MYLVILIVTQQQCKYLCQASHADVIRCNSWGPNKPSILITQSMIQRSSQETGHSNAKTSHFKQPERWKKEGNAANQIKVPLYLMHCLDLY